MRKRFFNVAGPCVPKKHYILDPFRGIGNELMDLIDQEHYFVIHAARQSGKTTLLQALADKISARGTHFDSLMEIMEESRIRKVLDSILGDKVANWCNLDDFQYATDMGLVRRVNGNAELANPIYTKLIA
ncbi:MAG: hypothetical protein LBU70_00130 [Chitinispirillales bacterium]|jgi:hypothetical protein|nr:hypothetical protein [Chitinispirillales bacterium]